MTTPQAPAAQPLQFWLESARFVVSHRAMLYVDPQTGIPSVEQAVIADFVASLTEDEVELLERPEFSRWKETPLPKAGCLLLDLQTANVLVTVHDAIKPEAQRKFRNLPLMKAVPLAWKCVR
jgi:hypothetical protein